LEEIHQRLDEKMTEPFQGVYFMYVKRKVNMRQAAYLCLWRELPRLAN